MDLTTTVAPRSASLVSALTTLPSMVHISSGLVAAGGVPGAGRGVCATRSVAASMTIIAVKNRLGWLVLVRSLLLERISTSRLAFERVTNFTQKGVRAPIRLCMRDV